MRKNLVQGRFLGDDAHGGVSSLNPLSSLRVAEVQNQYIGVQAPCGNTSRHRDLCIDPWAHPLGKVIIEWLNIDSVAACGNQDAE